jgi:Stage II sporulation protein E (SpoIIE)
LSTEILALLAARQQRPDSGHARSWAQAAHGDVAPTRRWCRCGGRPENTRLYLFSDGAFEVQRADGTMMTLDELVHFINRPACDEGSDLDQLFQHLTEARGDDALEDDFSIVRFNF